MVDNMIFQTNSVSRISDIARVQPANHDKDSNNGASYNFQELLEKEKANIKKNTVKEVNEEETITKAYGFMNYYNGKAQNAYFYLVKPVSDIRA